MSAPIKEQDLVTVSQVVGDFDDEMLLPGERIYVITLRWEGTDECRARVRCPASGVDTWVDADVLIPWGEGESAEPEPQPCTWKVSSTDQINGWCPRCKHSHVVHGGILNPAIKQCVLCELKAEIDRARRSR